MNDSREEREYSVQRWAWMLVPQMVILGAVIGGAVGAFLWSRIPEAVDGSVGWLLIAAGAIAGGYFFGVIAERLSRRDRGWTGDDTP